MIRRLVLAGVALAVLGVAVAGYAAIRPGSGTHEVVIPAGATTSQIGRILQREQVIGSDSLFGIAVRLRRLDGKIQAGRYEFGRGMGMWTVLNALARGPIEKGSGVTVPEGFTIRQIAERVERNTKISAADFIAAATSREGLRSQYQPDDGTSLEGFLYPETYFVSDHHDAVGLIGLMVREFHRRTDGLDWSYPEARGLSRYEAVIIASLIEREAKVPEDRAKVSAVIYNRLAKGMRLQIDITALYDAEQHKVPTRADLRRQSPYNTYLIDGLPPTPIANPGLDSIRAALRPAPIDALYYVVIDPSGRHGFTADPQEFERLKQQRPDSVH